MVKACGFSTTDLGNNGFCAQNDKTHDERGFYFVEVVWAVLMDDHTNPSKTVNELQVNNLYMVIDCCLWV